MANPIVTRCDDCGKEFEVNMQVESMEGTIEKNYFVCPQCGKEYLAFCTDQDIRKKQADLKMLWRKLHGATTAKKQNKIHLQIENLQKVIKEDLQKVRETVLANVGGDEA